MTINKRGTCSSSVVISSAVYVCKKCGHTIIVKNDENGSQKCPKCDELMELVSSNAEAVDNKSV